MPEYNLGVLRRLDQRMPSGIKVGRLQLFVIKIRRLLGIGMGIRDGRWASNQKSVRSDVNREIRRLRRPSGVYLYSPVQVIDHGPGTSAKFHFAFVHQIEDRAISI